MRRITKSVPLLFVFMLTLAVGVSLAASDPASKDSKAKGPAKAATMTNTAASKSAVKSPAKASTKKMSTAASKSAVKSPAKASTKKMSHVLAPAEDLSGTITAVAPTGKEVTLVGSSGVPYDFELTKKTQVEVSGKKIGVNKLAGEIHKQATVHFVPRSDGNSAQRIEISVS